MGKTAPPAGIEVEYVPSQVRETHFAANEVLGVRSVDLLQVPPWLAEVFS